MVFICGLVLKGYSSFFRKKKSLIKNSVQFKGDQKFFGYQHFSKHYLFVQQKKDTHINLKQLEGELSL